MQDNRTGFGRLSDYAISFHYVPPKTMYFDLINNIIINCLHLLSFTSLSQLFPYCQVPPWVPDLSSAPVWGRLHFPSCRSWRNCARFVNRKNTQSCTSSWVLGPRRVGPQKAEIFDQNPISLIVVDLIRYLTRITSSQSLVDAIATQ